MSKFSRNVLIVVLSILTISFISFIIWIGMSMSPGTHGNICTYKSNLSKNSTNKMIARFLRTFPKHQLPNRFNKFKLPYNFGNDSLDRNNPMNADTVNFFFYNDEKELIVWSGFSGIHYNWNEDGCVLAVIGIIDVKNGGKWKFAKDLSKEEKDSIIFFFENEILKQIDSVAFTREK